ncbi:membrane-fusion protein [Streptococcus varani]|uniref:Membrane-fusion protein n=1 Tax=Streptococcus varani TaxID=1608583 RepID=A0A0E4H4T5_9STRE|nr:efflux RND transporter periplasmic adaptor subunit [Streptococcus varani]CQR25583.1 membrane-fusion protein [Streptococcus varani]
MFKTKKAKIALFSGLGLVAVAVIAGAMLLVNGGGGKSATDSAEGKLYYTTVNEGSIASTTLLAGTVEAADEQYIYYDATKGNISEIKVKVGDQVAAGQALVQYDTGELQANLDMAVRSRDKIGRQIYDLRTNGQTVELSGDDSVDNKTVSSAQRSVDLQLQDLNDAYADAQTNIDKAQAALNETTVLSNVAGTVVEINKSVSKSNASSQTVVHIVNQGSLQVVGTLSEYDLANMAVDQEVKLTSKVYPDQSWAGKITYISNYPEANGAASPSAAGSSSSSNAKYPFKIALTSEVGPLKQGFSVNIEVINNKKSILVPVTAVVTKDDKQYVWTMVDGKAKRVEVTLGGADAVHQEVTSGLVAGDQVISNPSADLEDGKEVKAVEETTDQAK